jgi:hypothetical protein
MSYPTTEDLCLKHFDFLWPLSYPHRSNESYLEHRQTVADGAWTNFGSLLEHAIHTVGDISKHNVAGEDFHDESDAKLSSVRTSGKGKQYGAPITNLHRKAGYIRAAVYERKQDKWYFFLIPFSAYFHISKTSNIEIPFNMDGSPKKKNKCKVNWWDYHKETFAEICIPVISVT